MPGQRRSKKKKSSKKAPKEPKEPVKKATVPNAENSPKEKPKGPQRGMDITMAVLRWVDASLDALQRNPVGAGLKLKGELEKNKELIKGAVKDALLDEFKPYADLIERALNS